MKLLTWIETLIAKWQALTTDRGGCPRCGHGCFLPIEGAEPLHRCASCRQALIVVRHPLPKGSILWDDENQQTFVRQFH